MRMKKKLKKDWEIETDLYNAIQYKCILKLEETFLVYLKQ